MARKSGTGKKQPQNKIPVSKCILNMQESNINIACRGISFEDLCAANPRTELSFGHRLSAMPKFLAMLRVPARVLGNAMFSNGFEWFSYALRGSPTTNKLTKASSPNISSLLQGAQEREMSL